jgi:hypothetical protein
LSIWKFLHGPSPGKLDGGAVGAATCFIPVAEGADLTLGGRFGVLSSFADLLKPVCCGAALGVDGPKSEAAAGLVPKSDGVAAATEGS